VASSRLFYAIMRHVAGLRSFPPSGSDFFLLDRQVTGALTQFGEHNVSAMSLLSWMGFRQDFVYYDKAARLHGRSGWTLEKKIKLAIDSITSFTYLPIRVMSYFGFVVAALGFLYAAWIVVNAFHGYPVPGWSSLAVIVLLLGGLQMMMLGVLGEYLWRALDEARRRPRWIAEAVIPAAPLGVSAEAVAAAGAGTPSKI